MMQRQTRTSAAVVFSGGYFALRVLENYCHSAELSVFRAPYRICSSSGMLSVWLSVDFDRMTRRTFFSLSLQKKAMSPSDSTPVTPRKPWLVSPVKRAVKVRIPAMVSSLISVRPTL